MTPRYQGPDRRRRGRRSEDDVLAEQRDANEKLVLATVRAEDAAESARGGLEVAKKSVKMTRAALELALSEAARLNEELVRAMAGEKRAREEAEAANRAKDEFLAMLGHELRNPLAPIVAAVDVMKLRGDMASREHDIIERHTVHVVRLVDDLLDVSRIAHGKIELLRVHVELAELVTTAVEMTSTLIVREEHRLTVAVPVQGLLLDADKARIAQVISNLLTNAARYTPSGGEITLGASRSGDTIEMVVSDTGIGIEQDMLPRIFDLFTQAKQSSERTEGGLGLGLALVRNLVALHGGTVEARSDGLGRGTTFIVRLPAAVIAQRAESPVAPPLARGKAVERRRILIVDDNVDAAQMVAEVLRMKGHDVFVAHDGPDALALLDESEVDTAILDIGLPGMDGYELAGRLRARPSMKSARLIALTGYGQDADRERTKGAGFDAHLVKPVSVRDLTRTLSGDSSTEIPSP